jgi:hypothetical protein
MGGALEQGGFFGLGAAQIALAGATRKNLLLVPS